MRIIAVVRTRDEAANIERFCMSYQWADKILVADGGSLDNTVDIAKSMPKTEVRNFPIKKEMANGYWRNPEAEHITFLVDWARDESADWILLDDCDCHPNPYLQRVARPHFIMIDDTDYNYMFALRLYLWKDGQYFPKVSKNSRGHYTYGLWGWRSSINLRFENTQSAYDFFPKPNYRAHTLKRNFYNIIPPACLLHHSWENDAILNKKLVFYNESGQIPGIQHPLGWAGKPKSLPDWALRSYG